MSNDAGAAIPSLDEAAHWSSHDELLVWTVSRLDGGRRSGSETDCHVVYAINRTHFVEQTRRYRASAQQAIAMLQNEQSLGRVQRKVELETVMAIHSDPRSGRLSIRTLNGTHRLDPVNDDEAQVLREIAMELEVRMPAGGASFDRYAEPDFPTEDRRHYSVEDDRRAAVAVNNARAEDEPDTIEPARYELPETPVQIPPDIRQYTAAASLGEEVLAASAPAAASRESVAPADESPFAPVAQESVPHHLLANLPTAEAPAETTTASTLPSDITVAGGLAIKFEPQRHVPDAAAISALQESPYGAPMGQPDSARQHATTDPAPEQPARYETPAATHPDPAAPLAAHQQAAASLPGPEEDRRLIEDGGFPAAFDRRQQRAQFRAQTAESQPVQGHASAPPASASAPGEPPITAAQMYTDQPAARPPSATPVATGTPRRSIPAGSGAAFFVDEQRDLAAESNPAQSHPAESHPAQSPPAQSNPAQGSVDRRSPDQNEEGDPNLPSVFDRRNLRAASETTPGWLTPGTAAALAHVEPGEDDEVADEADNERPSRKDGPAAGPPVISAAPSSGAVTGGAVGFNADFDVNPFR